MARDGGRPLISIIVATHERRDILAYTLERLAQLELDHSELEIIAVDNASRQDIPGVVEVHPNATLIRLPRNIGSCAKALGVPAARAPYILFLDDDSYPRSGSLSRMLERFEENPRLAAAGFTVHLPDGREECSALPHVFVGCGVGLRADVLREVGGLDRSFFMQAEEYDLAFRLLRAGWVVDVFSDLAVEHLKTPTARRGERTTYYDIRNNLRVAARYLPREHYAAYRADWLERYDWLSHRLGHQQAYWAGRRAGWLRAAVERVTYATRRLDSASLETVFRWGQIEHQMGRLAAAGVRRVGFVDLGKNIYAFHRGAQRAGVSAAFIADDIYAAPGRCYRGVPVVTLSAALTAASRVDTLIVSNTSYAHAERRAAQLAEKTRLPVHAWFRLARKVGQTRGVQAAPV
ncbi:N-glycosyltransferase [Phycisphaerae bacterium RAS1]|nr:N-glycosyltransferase [Phycisphaerae bacterium RAS1]